MKKHLNQILSLSFIMATLKSETQEVEVAEGNPIQLAAEELGVPFGCRHGMCGTCQVEVVEGIEHLSPPNEREQAMGMTGPYRLCCQASIKNGVVKLKV